MNTMCLFAMFPRKPSSKLPVSKESGPFFSPEMQDRLLIVFAVLVVGLIAIVWAVYLRRRSYRDRRSPTLPGAVVAPGRRQHRRRKRKEAKSRNPTLAETGGLPPVKEKPFNPMQGL